jgi:hypothetical protein
MTTAQVYLIGHRYWQQARALKEAVVQAISRIEHGEHSAAREMFTEATHFWTAETS